MNINRNISTNVWGKKETNNMKIWDLCGRWHKTRKEEWNLFKVTLFIRVKRLKGGKYLIFAIPLVLRGLFR